jgi:DNA-3-methyladenine glycosylase II
MDEAERISRKILGLDFDLPAFYAFAEQDEALAPIAANYRGLRPTLSATAFEMLVTSITAQQINLKFAFQVRSRFVRAYGKSLLINGAPVHPVEVALHRVHAFPTPAQCANLKIEAMREMQFSTRKAEYIIVLANAITSGKLNLDMLEQASEAEIADALISLKGIGQWTVDWFLARYLGRGNAVAIGDLGVRKALEHYYFKREKQKPEQLRALVNGWGEFANLCTHYLLFDFYMNK